MAALLGALPAIQGCDSSATSSTAGRVAMQINAVVPPSAASTGSTASATQANDVVASGPITLTGTNGTLVIDDLQLIVSRIRLKRAAGDCESADSSSTCRKFKGGPFLVSLLDGTAADVVTADVPEGNYTALEFRAQNLDPSDDDEIEEDGNVKNVELLIAELRNSYPNYPRKASMVAHGTFTSTEGTSSPFTVYFQAEIEIRKSFAEPFRVPADAKVVVDLDAASWFMQGTKVVNLAAQDGKTLRFELELENAIRIGKDHEHD